MNKRELAKVYVKMSPKNISIVQAGKEIEEFLETVKEAIALDKEVKFPRRGIFEILTRKPRVVACYKRKNDCISKKDSKIQSI